MRSPMEAMSPPPASCFPARQNLSSMCRLGSIPIPIHSRSFGPTCSPGCRSLPLSPLSSRPPREATARRLLRMWWQGRARRSWRRKRHSSWRAAAPRCWRRPIPSMDAWRSLRATMSWKLPRSRSSPRRVSPSSSIPTIPMDGLLPRMRCSLSPIACGAAADCCWSTRPSWRSGLKAQALAITSRRATSSCCAHSANFMVCPVSD